MFCEIDCTDRSIWLNFVVTQNFKYRACKLKRSRLLICLRLLIIYIYIQIILLPKEILKLLIFAFLTFICLIPHVIFNYQVVLCRFEKKKYFMIQWAIFIVKKIQNVMQEWICRNFQFAGIFRIVVFFLNSCFSK